MKRVIIIALISICLLGCFSTESGSNESRSVNLTGTQAFTNAIDKEWKLIEVYVNDVNIQFSRDNQQEFNKNIYIMTFNEQMVSGIGAPNRYSAPYTLGDNQAIEIKPMISTMMAALFEPNNLSEYEYMSYVQGAYKWDLVNDKLTLYSKVEGKEIRLVFAL